MKIACLLLVTVVASGIAMPFKPPTSEERLAAIVATTKLEHFTK